jgi:alpha-mannosidase
VSVAVTGLANGLIQLEVDPVTGTFAIDGHAGLDLLVDDGDEGDTYNYSPPATDTVIDRPTSVRIERVEAGPLRAKLRVTRTYEWPERIAGGERVGSRPVTVTTELQLHAGERLVRVDTTFENPSRDHRLRAWFPLPEPAVFSRAECAFGIVQRGLEAEGGRHERGLPTFPSRRFVTAGGLTVVHEGLLEYELVDGGRALALTLLRATGMLSRDHMTYRPDPAGPAIAVEGPQLIGLRHLRYVVQMGDADPYALVDHAFLPLTVLEAPGGGHRPATGAALTVDGAEVSALHRVAGALELRVFNPTDRPATVRVAGRRGWLVNLRGQAEEPFYEVFPLRPWGMATARLEEG